MCFCSWKCWMKHFLGVLLGYKPLLSLETLSFSTFIILLNLLFHSSLTPGPSSRTAVYRMGSFGQGASGPLFSFFFSSSLPLPSPFLLNQNPSSQDFTGVGRVEIVIYDSSFVPEGHLKDADFVSKELLTTKPPQDRKCSFKGRELLVARHVVVFKRCCRRNLLRVGTS